MNPIQMVDLKSQYLNIKEDIDRGIASVLSSAQFVKAPVVTELEQELCAYIGAKHCICVGNGTDALQIAMMALNLQPGDEVLIPSFTFIAAAEVAALLRLKPVAVDVDSDTMTISPESVRKSITPRTKAIVPVHLFGQCADMEPLLKLAEEHHLYVIEDGAQAIGATYTFANKESKDCKESKESKQACTMGHIGTTSFFPSKNLGCYGDGGAVFTNDDELAHRVRAIASHGSDTRYHHDIVGVNSRLDAIQAAVLRAKLPHLDEYTSARRKAAEWYQQALADCQQIKLPVCNPKSTHVYHQYTIRLADSTTRDALKQYLADHSVPSMIYYPIPTHLQTAYAEQPTNPLPHSEHLANTVLSLPMHTELSEQQLQYITDTIHDFFA